MAKPSQKKPSLPVAIKQSAFNLEDRAMSIQYVLAVFSEDRTVLANGQSVGVTNHTIMLPSDEYTITLSGNGYNPESKDIVLTGTSIMKPLVVLFSKI